MGVAIHGELGNPPITDATAVSEDVISGKIFYNNNGRNLGTSSAVKVNTFEFSFPSNKGYYRSKEFNYGLAMMYDDSYMLVSIGKYTSVTSSGVESFDMRWYENHVINIPTMQRILSIEFDGIRLFTIPAETTINPNTPSLFASERKGTWDAWFNIYQQKIYGYTNVTGVHFKIQYI